jgi:hypothetical protein
MNENSENFISRVATSVCQSVMFENFFAEGNLALVGTKYKCHIFYRNVPNTHVMSSVIQ